MNQKRFDVFYYNNSLCFGIDYAKILLIKFMTRLGQ